MEAKFKECVTENDKSLPTLEQNKTKIDGLVLEMEKVKSVNNDIQCFVGIHKITKKNYLSLQDLFGV